VITGNNIPIRGEGRPLYKGTQGKVYKAQVDMEYNTIAGLARDNNNTEWSQLVAVKKLFLTNPNADWEVIVAEQMATHIQHAHFTTFYGAFQAPATINSQTPAPHYLISEYADGDLENHMLSWDPGWDTRAYVRMRRPWFRTQVRGLAAALERILFDSPEVPAHISMSLAF